MKVGRLVARTLQTLLEVGDICAAAGLANAARALRELAMEWGRLIKPPAKPAEKEQHRG